jgi:methylmalonyl-CoA mutase N-terminal domain/subunit
VLPGLDYSALERDQVGRLRVLRERRDGAGVAESLAHLRAAAAPYADERSPERPSLMPRIVEAVRARATVGEISDVLRDVWGEYRPAI